MTEIMQQHSPQPTWINQWAVSLLAPSRNAYSCKTSHRTVHYILVVKRTTRKRSTYKISSVLDDNFTRCTDKSLARHNSRCPRTESIVFLERGVRSRAELRVFSCHRGWKEVCRASRAISTTSRRELSSIFFLAREGAEVNSCNSGRNIRGKCNIVCHCQKVGGPV